MNSLEKAITDREDDIKDLCEREEDEIQGSH